MLRHNHVADEAECVLRAYLIKFDCKIVAGLTGSKQRAPAQTTERDEVKIALSVTALQWIAHCTKTRTLEIHKGAAPQPVSARGLSRMFI